MHIRRRLPRRPYRASDAGEGNWTPAQQAIAKARATDHAGGIHPAAKDLLAAIEQADMQSRLAEADRPHVLVAVLEGGPGHGTIACVLGPFPDLWTAVERAPGWQAELREGDPDGVVVIAEPLFDPATGD